MNNMVGSMFNPPSLQAQAGTLPGAHHALAVRQEVRAATVWETSGGRQAVGGKQWEATSGRQPVFTVVEQRVLRAAVATRRSRSDSISSALTGAC